MAASPASVAVAEASTSGSASASSMSALISKRAKAVHKKLQRINAYSEGTLNADQLRAIATKPTLEAVHNELNALLAQATAHEATARSEAQAEIDRLTTLANAHASRADEGQSQLTFLLQFLHLFALFQQQSQSTTTESPQLPPALAATVTPTDIHALTSVFFAFANAPLVESSASDAEGALELLNRIRSNDPAEIVISTAVPVGEASSSSVSTGISHSRIAELVQALTAPPPASTQFGSSSLEDAIADPEQGAAQARPDDETLDVPVQINDAASSSIPAPHQEPQQQQIPAYLNFDADAGFSVGTGPLPPSAGSRILFMQASEVEGEVEAEPPAPVFGGVASESQSNALQFDAGEQEGAGPVAEPAHTIEPEGGAVDGAPEVEPVIPAAQPDATATEHVPPVLQDLAEPAATTSSSAPIEAPPAVQIDTPAPAPPAAAAAATAKKIDWASLDDDDDEEDEISEEVMRSVVLPSAPAATPSSSKEATSAAAAAPAQQQQTTAPPPAAAEAEAARLVKQIDAHPPRANGSGSAPKGNRSGSGSGKTAAPPAPVLRKPEPVVDEDGFVMHTTKKTIRQQQQQQQLAAQQQQQQQQQRGGSGGRAARSGGRSGRGGAQGQGQGQGQGGQGQGQGRRERREGNASSSSDAAAAGLNGSTQGGANGQGKERGSGQQQQQPQSQQNWRSNSGSGPGASRGSGGAGSGNNGSGNRGRGNRNRASGSGSGGAPRAPNAQADAPAPSS